MLGTLATGEETLITPSSGMSTAKGHTSKPRLNGATSTEAMGSTFGTTTMTTTTRTTTEATTNHTDPLTMEAIMQATAMDITVATEISHIF